MSWITYLIIATLLLVVVVSLGFIFGCPWFVQHCSSADAVQGCSNLLVLTHWLYLGICILILCTAYILFMKKYYHLHEEWLASRR